MAVGAFEDPEMPTAGPGASIVGSIEPGPAGARAVAELVD